MRYLSNNITQRQTRYPALPIGLTAPTHRAQVACVSSGLALLFDKDPDEIVCQTLSRLGYLCFCPL